MGDRALLRHIGPLLLAGLALAACERQESLAFPDLDRRLGVEPLCAALYREGMSGPVRIPPAFEFTWPSLARLALRQADEPFSQVSPKDVSDALPKDLGPLQGCRPGGFKLDGKQVVKEIVLDYQRAGLTVTLRYEPAEAPKLRFFRVGVPEPKTSEPRPAPKPKLAAAPAPPRPKTRFDAEALQAYTDWSRLEKEMMTALKATNADLWQRVQSDSTALSLEILAMDMHLTEDGGPPEAKAYADALARCSEQIGLVAGRKLARLTEGKEYPEEALLDDLTRYRALKLELKKRTGSLRGGR